MSRDHGIKTMRIFGLFIFQNSNNEMLGKLKMQIYVYPAKTLEEIYKRPKQYSMIEFLKRLFYGYQSHYRKRMIPDNLVINEFIRFLLYAHQTTGIFALECLINIKRFLKMKSKLVGKFRS